MEDLRGEINGRMEKHLEEMLDLAQRAGEEIRLCCPAADSASGRRKLFEILRDGLEDRSDREDLFFVLVADDGEELAWSGEGYLSLDNIRSAASSGSSISVSIFRGNIITAAIIAKELPGIGDLMLIDRLEVLHHLGERYARSGRFIDRIARLTGSDVTLYPVREQGSVDGREGESIFPLVFHGERIGTWSIGQLDREGYLARLRSREGKLLGLLLLLPLIASFIFLKSWLRRYFLDGDRYRRDGRPAYIILLGLALLLLRLFLLKASFPASIAGGALFSSKYFATGFLEDGSMSAGEFFISGLFISLFLLHICPMANWRRGTWNVTGRMDWVRSAAGSASAIILSFSAPFVHERLLKDSLLSLVIEQGFLHSVVTVVWELGFFLLFLSLSLLIACALRIAGVLRGRDSRTLPACALLWVALLSTSIYMALHACGEAWRSVFMPLEGGMVLVGGCLISVAVSEAMKSDEKRSGAWINLPLILLLSMLSAGFIYPGIVRYRHLALEEAGEELLEQMGAPYENWAAFVLEETADDLLEKSGEIFSESREVQGLAFYAWTNSRLGRLGQRTSLVIYDGEGTEISEFSLTDLELDESFSDFFLQRARERDDPFIYHGYSGGSEFYSAVVPYWENGKLKDFMAITLPMDLEERVGGGPIRLFLDETDKGQLNIPEPLELEVYSIPGEGATSGWQSRYEDGGTLRCYRMQMRVGGVGRVVEIAFRRQESGE